MKVIVYERAAICGTARPQILFSKTKIEFIPRVGEFVTVPLNDGKQVTGFVDIVEHELETDTAHVVLTRCRYRDRPNTFEPTLYG